MTKIITSIIISFVFFAVSANASEEYIIKKGDTLWDISESELKDNFLWPKLWKFNPQIKDPDLIFPDDTLRIPTREELMRLGLPGEEITPVAEPTPTPVEPIVEIPQEAPPRYILDKNLYIASGWISSEFPGIGQIISSPTERTIFGNNDIVYIKSDNDITDGDIFLAIRDVKIVRHPEKGKKLGHQIRVTGILEITGKDHDIPKARVISAFEDVQVGDGIIPFQDTEPPVIPDTPRTPEISGYIVESYMNFRMSGRSEIVFLDKGLNDGLETGDIFSVFAETPVKRPIGTIQIVSLQPTTSSAIILDSTQEITIGDKWGRKKTLKLSLQN